MAYESNISIKSNQLEKIYGIDIDANIDSMLIDMMFSL